MAHDEDQDLVPVPEADHLEQQQPANPLAADDEPGGDVWPDLPLDIPPRALATDEVDGAAEADEADRLEQAQDVVGDPDDDYGRDQE